MLNLIAGILVPQEGQVKVDDTIVNQLSENEHRNFRKVLRKGTQLTLCALCGYKIKQTQTK